MPTKVYLPKGDKVFIPNGRGIFRMAMNNRKKIPFLGIPKYTQIGIFGL
jgi:hypothetical protein